MAGVNGNVKNRRFEEEGTGVGVRHLQMLLLFIGLTVVFAMRVNLSVAVVAMSQASKINPNFPEYPLTEQKRAVVMSSFFWGYLATQIPAGILSRRFGGKVTLVTGVTICSVLTLLTPFAASLGGWNYIIGLRMVEGLGQGVFFPSAHTIISAWIPPKERGALATYAYTGAPFGTIIMLATSGWIASSPLGWPSIFYLSGASGVLWVIAYYIWGASSPQESKSISEEEIKLIEMAQSNAAGKSQQPHNRHAIPWLSFLTSGPFLALIATHAVSAWGYWTLLTQIPTYMSYVLGKDIKSNALLSSLPYIANLVMSFVFVWISKAVQKTSLSLAFNRKFFNTIGTYVPMVLLVALGYVPKDNDTLVVVLLTLTVGVNAATHLGFQVNHIDLSPNFAGTLMGITNGLGSIMSFCAPLLVGKIVPDKQSVEQWRWVFFIAAFFYFVGNGLFVLFGSATVQPWNEPPSKSRRSSIYPELESQKPVNSEK
ncbi:putative inorganic phosphate cotransporter [Drosophila sulfurigaster albostrigata]|uniref:putative inorganic phosphate cotransporter n=1 Tax=Drosophila sulfurigaster albostrigata TaxID=89887 RepID=UPI002D21A973|nr:putative inorganic phosphate cotransporter [Drosophila sulfurigaster albostrigata]